MKLKCTRVITESFLGMFILDIYPFGICRVHPSMDEWADAARAHMFRCDKYTRERTSFLKRHIHGEWWLINKRFFKARTFPHLYPISDVRRDISFSGFRLWRSIDDLKASKESPKVTSIVQINGKRSFSTEFSSSMTPEQVKENVKSYPFLYVDRPIEEIVVIPNPVVNIITKKPAVIADDESLIGPVNLHESDLECDVCGQPVPVVVFPIHQDAAIEYRLQICRECLLKVAAKMP